MNVPPAAPAAPANLAQALQDHDHAKRSMDIPLFYGQIGKDTIAARLLIVRINDAGAIANWNNDRKLLEFKMCLRDKAVGWFEGLMEDGIATNNWDTVKAEFLETYEPKYSAKTTCANFTNLNQKAEEINFLLNKGLPIDPKCQQLVKIFANNCFIEDDIVWRRIK
jgi:Retrotransposon gag protein